MVNGPQLVPTQWKQILNDAVDVRDSLDCSIETAVSRG